VTILEAAGTQLPIVESQYLKFDKVLGRGSTFQVNREIYGRPGKQYIADNYYVAVKHVIPSNDIPRVPSRYDSVVRELRVLTHPSLVENDSILPILAYGWTDSLAGRRPYLVVDYSMHGTLTQYLWRVKTNLNERREFSVDVAAGLKAIHDSKIIHGDVKPGNVLVFECEGPSRHQRAKLADFGGSIFEHEGTQRTTYGGTVLYNGPEQEGRGRFCDGRSLELHQFYYSDIYSLGITIWETLKTKSYMDEDWLIAGESQDDFLRRISAKETDGILKRALQYCDADRFSESWPLDPEEVIAVQAIRNTFELTLKDEPLQRANIDRVIEALAYGTR
jgi:serine/threonine protein kinase